MPAITVYSATVPVFKQLLGGLVTCIDKAAAHCEAKKIDPAAITTFRLYPDMFAFARQVQITCDTAKGCMARLAGVEIPKHEDTETTFTQLKERIAKTLAFIDTIKPEQLNGVEDREIVLQMRAGPRTFQGLGYAMNFALPNFYFHVTTAYNVLRHNGIEVGKNDYLGKS